MVEAAPFQVQLRMARPPYISNETLFPATHVPSRPGDPPPPFNPLYLFSALLRGLEEGSFPLTDSEEPSLKMTLTFFYLSPF